MRFTKTYIALVFIFFSPFYLSGQNIQKIDSIENVLTDAQDSLKPKLLCDIAELYRRDRNAPNAIQFAERAIEMAVSVSDFETLVRANSLLAGIYYRQDSEKSFNYWIAYLDALKNKGDTAEFVLSVFRRSEIFAKIKPERVIDLAEQTLEIGKVSKDKNIMARSYGIKGLVKFNTGNYKEALDSWELSLSLHEELDNKNEIGTMLTNIGVIYKNWGDYQQATDYYQRNLDLQEEIGDTLQIARALSNMGNIFFYVGVDFQKALGYYKESLEYFQLLDNPINTANTHNNIGLVYRELNDF